MKGREIFMKQYVVGFIFNWQLNKVLLIEKDRPEWQKGLLNGIGGKVEDIDECYGDNDKFKTAMRRESIEECGIECEWESVGTIFNKDVSIVKVFYAVLESDTFHTKQLKSETEELVVCELQDIFKFRHKTILNIPLLVMACLSKIHNESSFDNIRIYQ